MDCPYMIDFTDNIRESVIVETMYAQDDDNPSLIDILGLGMGREPKPNFEEVIVTVDYYYTDSYRYNGFIFKLG